MLKKSENNFAFLKMGILGFPKSGKTFTASQVAVGLAKHIQSKKPIAYLDTEAGHTFVRPIFEADGLSIIVDNSRAFNDLVKNIDQAEKECDICVIDSVTHFWQDVVRSYQIKRNIERLTLKDWMPIKQEWREFSDRFLNSKLHIIMCGRAGYEFDFKEDDEGFKELVKTGTKMKVESDLGYEPSLLVEMERIREEKFMKHRAWIIGDRAWQLDGKFFDNPTFETFLPHIERLNLGGKHDGVDLTRNSTALFDTPQSKSYEYKRREIALEEIKQELILQYPGRSDADKQKVIRLLKGLFGTAATSALEQLQADKLEAGLKTIRETAKSAEEHKDTEVKEDD